MNQNPQEFNLRSSPIHVETVRLRVRELDRVSEFYQRVMGLQVLESSGSRAVLGVGDRPLLLLDADSSLAPHDPRAAGLFHTAFLLPGRADLARWLMHVIENRVPLQGASDHIVSEAIYLADPEGNGIEVYADRPPAMWTSPDGKIRMSTDPLDVEGLLQEAGDGKWNGFPETGLIGHVHLKVGDTAKAQTFYAGVLGFDLMLDYPGAKFFGSGGYHHQLAGNIWNSRNAGVTPEHMAGLAEVTLRLRDPAMLAAIRERAAAAAVRIEDHAAGASLRDPWGTKLTLVHS